MIDGMIDTNTLDAFVLFVYTTRCSVIHTKCKGDIELKRLNVSIDDDLHKQLKMAVAEGGTTIGQFVIEAITEKLENDKQQKQEKVTDGRG